MISTGYNQIKWGILISIIHIYISTELGGFEIVPAFIGYFLIMRGTSAICSETNLEYMNSLKAESLRLFILSCVYWITGIFLGYGLANQKLILIVFYLFDVLFFGNLLNKTVKYLKESMRLDEADKLRKNRMTFIKCYLALIIFSVIAMIPNAMGFFDIGKVAFRNLLSSGLSYLSISFMLILKLWLSMVIQKYSIH